MAKSPNSQTVPEQESQDSQKSSRLEELQRQIDELVAERERIKGEGGTSDTQAPA